MFARTYFFVDLDSNFAHRAVKRSEKKLFTTVGMDLDTPKQPTIPQDVLKMLDEDDEKRKKRNEKVKKKITKC